MSAATVSTRPYAVRQIDETSCTITLPAIPGWRDGEDVMESTLYVPPRGGYVRVSTSADGASDAQVCERLESRGNTLSWHAGGETFTQFIRREMRRRQRADKRFAAERGW